MNRLVYYLFRFTSYLFYKLKYPGIKNLRFNGYFISVAGEGEFFSGSNSYISFYTRVHLEKGTKVVIGDNVSIGHNVRIYTSKLDADKLVKNGVKSRILGDVHIGNNVLVSGNVYIGPGVTICDDVFIGANSVVPYSIKEPGVYSGIPAKKLIKKNAS